MPATDVQDLAERAARNHDMTPHDDTEPSYREFAPQGALARYVRTIWVLRAPFSGQVQPVVPDGCPEIVLNFGDPVVRLHEDGRREVHPTRLLVGQMTEGTALQPGGRVSLAGIKLHPWAATAFLGLPASLTVNQIVPLEAAVSARWLPTLSVLDDADPDTLGPRLLEAASTYVNRRPEPSHLARSALIMLAGADEPYSVGTLARALGSGERRLQRAFASEIGLSPKLIVRIVRTQRAMRLALAHRRLTWAQVAARSGYHDHAHLVRDFRQFALQTPTAFRAAAGLLTEHLLA
jgi:AraC-like DNA-binding protein